MFLCSKRFPLVTFSLAHQAFHSAANLPLWPHIFPPRRLLFSQTGQLTVSQYSVNQPASMFSLGLCPSPGLLCSFNPSQLKPYPCFKTHTTFFMKTSQCSQGSVFALSFESP